MNVVSSHLPKPLLDGCTKIMAFCSDDWLSPLLSPAAALALTKLVALMWAFQQQGWSYCIPCIAFLAGKVTRLVKARWQGSAPALKYAAA